MIENICDFRGKLNSLLQQLGNPGWGEVAAQIILKVISNLKWKCLTGHIQEIKKIAVPPL